MFGGFEHRERYKDRYRWYAQPQSPGVSRYSAERIATSIAVLRDCLPAPVFVAYPHWGNHYAEVNNAQRDLAAELIEAGVDLIIGHGTHSAQAIETVAGRPVLYGLGNFVWNTPGHYTKFGAPPYSLVAALVFHGKQGQGGISLRLFPILTDNTVTNFQSRPVTRREFAEAVALVGQSVEARFVKRSAKAGPCLEIKIDGAAKLGASEKTEVAETTLQER